MLMQVARTISEIFAEMIFSFGDVHCDPHEVGLSRKICTSLFWGFYALHLPHTVSHCTRHLKGCGIIGPLERGGVGRGGRWGVSCKYSLR